MGQPAVAKERLMATNEQRTAPTLRKGQSAETVLERRVRNSPPERNEARWIPGWKKRINTYVPRDVNTYNALSAQNDETDSLEFLIDVYRDFVCKFL